MGKYDLDIERRGFAKGYFTPTAKQIEAFLHKHFQVKPRKNNKQLRICSPFVDDDGYHFSIGVDKGMCHDWRGDEWAGPPNPTTGKRNTSFMRFVQRFLNCTYRDAIRAIAAACPDAPPSLDELRRHAYQSAYVDIQEEPLVALPDGSEPLATSTQPTLSRILHSWLASRGITPADVQRCRICHLAADVIWPYYEYDILVYWQQRSRLNKRFLFPDESVGVTKGQFIYGFDDIEPASELVVTESIFGKFTLGSQCVATGGADLTVDQIRKIRLLGPRDGVILSPDNDGAGMQSVLRNGKLLQDRGFNVAYSLPPRLEYVEDGEQKFTKDWNELLTGAGIGLPDIRREMERRIVKFGMMAVIRLRTAIAEYERRKKARPPD